MEFIHLKNTKNFDSKIGGVTMTFFPINFIIIPFILPVVGFQSERLSDFILKIQYAILIFIYCLIAIIFSVILIPLLILKSLINQIYVIIF